jgi:DNA repair protein RadC
MLARMAIRDWPRDERPREKLLAKGASALSDAELLAILFRTGGPGRSALDLARAVLQSFDSLRRLLAADRARFCSEPGLGPARYAELQAAAEISRRQLSEPMRAGQSLASPRATCDFLRAHLRDLEHEVFCCLYLDLCGADSYVYLAPRPLLFLAFPAFVLNITTVQGNLGPWGV